MFSHRQNDYKRCEKHGSPIIMPCLGSLEMNPFISETN